MAILYRIHQDNRKNSVHKGKWYARAVMNGTVGIDQIAEVMQRNSTVKKSDILAVITELVETMQDFLQNSMRVKIKGLGSFKIGLKTKAANKPEDFNAAANVVGMRVNFQPELTISKDGVRRRALLNGAKVQETAHNTVNSRKKKKTEPEGSTPSHA
ncbi:HU family DNA-binding protein [Hoylesella enoeca]|uniref:DNA-binding protein n=1 Tax=Hoylesella enoeca TaxID=76123 RepID=A0A0S2KM52_9BACT|nr:HU family DNA-binding protein [Hoylesella enoeca]ALO49384.1 DNA-binding protein [Hoylesella enoeca]